MTPRTPPVPLSCSSSNTQARTGSQGHRTEGLPCPPATPTSDVTVHREGLERPTAIWVNGVVARGLPTDPVSITCFLVKGWKRREGCRSVQGRHQAAVGAAGARIVPDPRGSRLTFVAGLPLVPRQVADAHEVIPGLDTAAVMLTQVGGAPEGTQSSCPSTSTAPPCPPLPGSTLALVDTCP